MPGEFERHSGVWMLWPTRPDNWRDGARPAQDAFVRVAAAIQPATPVTVGAAPEHVDAARAAMPDGVRVVALDSDDAWMRDVGPTFVTDGAGRAVTAPINPGCRASNRIVSAGKVQSRYSSLSRNSESAASSSVNNCQAQFSRKK